jgi:hypothetical protein
MKSTLTTSQELLSSMALSAPGLNPAVLAAVDF